MRRFAAIVLLGGTLTVLAAPPASALHCEQFADPYKEVCYTVLGAPDEVCDRVQVCG